MGRDYSSKNITGFTLIELLLVIAILGILITALIVLINPIDQIQKSKDTQRKSELNQLQRTLEAYYNDNGRYPPSTGTAVAPNYRLYPASVVYDWDSTWAAYNTKLPKDPDTTRTYAYAVSTDGQTYRIYASLERGARDSQVCVPGTNNVCPSIAANTWSSGASCGTDKVCNFAVSSPNVSP